MSFDVTCVFTKKSRIGQGPIGRFALGSELAREQKGSEWWVMTSGTTPVKIFITINSGVFAPRANKVTGLVFLATGRGFALSSQKPSPLHQFLLSVRRMTSFRTKNVPFGNPENKILYFDFMFPQNVKIWGNFRRDFKNFAKKPP